MADKVVARVDIAADPETVWKAVRDPQIIGNWFGWEADSLAEEIDFIFDKGTTADEAAKHPAFGEWEGVSYAFAIIAAGGGTRLEVERRGPDIGAEYDEIVEGWISFVQQLRLLLERHAGETRHTLYFSGKAKPNSGALRERLGVAAAGVGAPVTLAAPEPLAGRIWHQGRHQTGIAIPAWGDGLLVVADRPAADDRPHGGGYAILTTFGRDPAQLAATEQSWRAFWNGHFAQG